MAGGKTLERRAREVAIVSATTKHEPGPSSRAIVSAKDQSAVLFSSVTRSMESFGGSKFTIRIRIGWRRWGGSRRPRLT